MDGVKQGAEESALGRRPLIRNTLLGALGAVRRSPASCCCATSARCRATSSRHTMWRKGKRLVT